MRKAETLEFFITNLFNGITFGMVLFFIAAGMSIVLGVMGITNFAHGSLYAIGAYMGWTIATKLGLPWWLGHRRGRVHRRAGGPSHRAGLPESALPATQRAGAGHLWFRAHHRQHHLVDLGRPGPHAVHGRLVKGAVEMGGSPWAKTGCLLSVLVWSWRRCFGTSRTAPASGRWCGRVWMTER